MMGSSCGGGEWILFSVDKPSLKLESSSTLSLNARVVFAVETQSHAVLALVEMPLSRLKKKHNSRIGQRMRGFRFLRLVRERDPRVLWVNVILAFNERTRPSRFMGNVTPMFYKMKHNFRVLCRKHVALIWDTFDILHNPLQNFQIRGWLGWISKYFGLSVTVLAISWSCQDSGLRKCTVKLF